MVDLAEKLHRQMVEAVFDPSALSVALADYAEASQALIGEFIVIGARQTLVTATHGGRTRDDIGDVEREYHTINPRVEYLPNYKVGKLTRDQDIISLEEINTNSAYQDALIPQDTAFYCCLTFENTLTSYSGLVAHRSFADGPFTDDEAKTVERLARACKPAFDLANRIDLHNAKTDCSEQNRWRLYWIGMAGLSIKVQQLKLCSQRGSCNWGMMAACGFCGLKRMSISKRRCGKVMSSEIVSSLSSGWMVIAGLLKFCHDRRFSCRQTPRGRRS